MTHSLPELNTAALQRASVPLLLLAMIAKQPSHGYGLTQELKRLGFAPLTGAQLYPALAKLEETGQISSEWEPQATGPARKVYSLTAGGRGDLARLTGDWNSFAGRVNELLS